MYKVTIVRGAITRGPESGFIYSKSQTTRRKWCIWRNQFNRNGTSVEIDTLFLVPDTGITLIGFHWSVRGYNVFKRVHSLP